MHNGQEPLRWLEISPGFACNCQCLGCHSCTADPLQQMDWPEVLRWLQIGRQRGARHLWLSGGEPTLRKDFFATLRAARQLGYQRIKVQTNGLLFAYPQVLQRALEAGMGEVNLLLKSRQAGIHDELNQTPGSLAVLDRAVEILRKTPLRLEGDILWTSRNAAELAEVVGHYADKGLKHFNLWLFSLVDQGQADLRALVPKLVPSMPEVLAAREAAQARGATFVSLNTPHCVVPPQAWDMQFDAAGMGLLVVNPGGVAFRLERSLIELGVYPAACEGCAARPWCHGLRQDYLDVHGEGELRPLTAADLQGRDPRGRVLDLP